MVDSSGLTRVTPLAPYLTTALRRDGCLTLRGTIPEDRLDALRAAFDAGERPSEAWPVPRGREWRHALVDLDPAVQDACRLPMLLGAAHAIIGGPFFLAQVEGREPLAGGGFQGLHRDGAGLGAVASALAFLDDYGPDNGATRVVAGSHGDSRPACADDEAQATALQGRAGDILVFDANLLHGAGRNASGARRRALLISFVAVTERQAWRATERLRAVRMETSETFEA